MAKRNGTTTRSGKGADTTSPPTAKMGAAMERRVLAFAKQLGWVVGTLQVKAEGLMDRDALNTQLAGVRDGAQKLLHQLAGAATGTAKKAPATTSGKRVAARSGGTVDAPGRPTAGRSRSIPMRPWCAARRTSCGRPRRWSRQSDAAGAAEQIPAPSTRRTARPSSHSKASCSQLVPSRRRSPAPRARQVSLKLKLRVGGAARI